MSLIFKKFYAPCVFLVLILFSLSCFGQKNTNSSLAGTLKEKYKDEKVVATRSSSIYDFQVENNQLTIHNTDDIDFISTEANVAYTYPVFYNDNIEILSNDVRYKNGRKMLKKTSCGNYEVESVFYSDAKVCAYSFNFNLAGTEINVNSSTRYNDPKYLTKIMFHDNFSVEKRELTFIVPEKVSMHLVEKNFEGFDIKKTITDDSGKKVITYTLEGLKKIKSEPNSLGLLYTYPHLIVVTNSFSYENGETVVLSSVDDLYKWYNGLVRQVVNNPDVYREEVNRLIENKASAEDKIRSIYYWVQDNIKYIAFEDGIAGFKPESADLVYTNKYGDCKGMANLTKEMLRLAGFDARLTWIGTNRIPYNYDLPSLAVDNHMICTVFHDEKQYILDPTEKYIALGSHGERIQGKEMLIENDGSYIRKLVPVARDEDNLVSRSETLTLTGESLTGKGELNINGEAKKNILYYSSYKINEDKEKLFDYLAVSDYRNEDKVTVTSTSAVDRDLPLIISYEYTLGNKVSSFEKEVYIDLDWDKSYKNFIIEKERTSDYYFERKIFKRMVKKIKIPTGYTVSHLPEGLSMDHDNFSCHISFTRKANEIIYSNEIKIPHGLIKKEDFEAWNGFIKALNKIYGDQIVLRKK